MRFAAAPRFSEQFGDNNNYRVNCFLHFPTVIFWLHYQVVDPCQLDLIQAVYLANG